MIGLSALTLATSILAVGPEVTVYNQGFALVKELKSFELQAGRQTVSLEDVAQQIDSTSVGFKCITPGLQLRVLEQNYQFDLISPLAILNKSIGNKIRFHRTVAGNRESLEGVLLSAPTSLNRSGSQRSYAGMVIRTDDGQIVLDPIGEVEVLNIPKGMKSKPTLLWDLEASKAATGNVELSYITGGMSWTADYVLTLDGAGKADLQGWVSVNNTSGRRFDEAKLKLLAGEVNQVPKPGSASNRAFDAAPAKMMAKAEAFKEEGLFEYHLYTLQRPATLASNETKQLSLLEGHNIKVQKRLILDSMENYGIYYPSAGEIGTGNIKPTVKIEFVNEQENGLGMPFPKGRVRVYQRDRSGSVQMLGEDSINHTPKKEKLSLRVGKSFDVVGVRKRTEFKALEDPRFVQESFSIEVRNRKETDEVVEVFERHWGDWKIVKQNMTWSKEDSNTAVFKVSLKPGEVRTVTYTVTTRW